MDVNKNSIIHILPSVLIVVIAIGVIVWEFHNIYQLSQLSKKNSEYFVEKQESIKNQIVVFINERLESGLEKTRGNIRAAENDPLLDDRNFLLYRSGQQVLPRSTKFKSGNYSAAKILYEKLLSTEPIRLISSENTPWAVRGKLFADFRLTIRAQHPDVSKLAVMDILSDTQSKHGGVSFDSYEDLAFLAAVGTYLDKYGSPKTSTMKTIISGGMASVSGTIIPGLGNLLLRSRSELTQEEFIYFRELILVLSEKYNVEHSQFKKLSSRQMEELQLDVRQVLYPSISNNGQWYVAPQEDDIVLGYQINLDKLISESIGYLRKLKILDFPANITVQSVPGSYYPAQDINIVIDAENWVAANSNSHHLTTLASFILVLLLSALLYFLSLQIRSQKYLTMKNDFVTAVSHDIKTPLSAIHLLSQALISRLGQNRDIKDYPEKILNQSIRLRNLTENILIFYGINENRKKPNLNITSVGSLLEKVESFSACDNQKQLDITVKNEEDASILADGELLSLVFNNLVNNSCKYNTNQVVNIKIRVSMSHSGKKVNISFADNGVGIPDRELKQVFEPYLSNQKNHPSHKKGVGIGLSLCRKIITLHQGKIEITDSDNAGTTIKLVFPAHRPRIFTQ